MKTKTTFNFVVAILAAFFAVSFAMASLPVSINEVEVNDVVLGAGTTLAGMAGETVPVVVRFAAGTDLDDLKVTVWIEGYKSDISASTARFDVINGSTYIKRLSLTLPSVQDMDNLNEGLTLYVRIADKNDEVEESYSIEMQRDSYTYEFLQADAPSKANAGEIIALDVVLKNIGLNELEDSFVIASIPELGIYKRVYFGDLNSVDCIDDCDEEDARERRIYLAIPSDVESGDYVLEVKASNYDTTSVVKKVISITGTTADDNEDKDTPDKTDEGIPTSILVLTVVLVIIFVVLLVVLIVLLAKKPAKSEDFGETSYY